MHPILGTLGMPQLFYGTGMYIYAESRRTNGSMLVGEQGGR